MSLRCPLVIENRWRCRREHCHLGACEPMRHRQASPEEVKQAAQKGIIYA